MNRSTVRLCEWFGSTVALVVTVIGLVGCDSHAEMPGREHRVVITNFAFEPEVVKAKAGDTITWVNRDIAPHTATGDDGTWDTGTLSKGESTSIVVEVDMEAGYFCRFHPNMKGSVAITTE